MTLELRPCITTLLIVYPPFLAAGIWFFRYMIRHKPLPDARRNRALTAVRFMMFVMLIPIGATASMAVLGWLDPLFFWVAASGR